MRAVKGIEKTAEVGSGNSSYKGVSDHEVKKIIGKAMEENGLCILPTEVEAKTQVDRWEEEDQWSKSTPKAMKSKQSIFTEVSTKYLLLHESGESMVLAGYGHGVDPQDKGAGKATTYALKYTLLYSFLVATGKIDDADMEHSESMQAPPKPKPFISAAQYEKLVARVKEGDLAAADKASNTFQFTQAQHDEISALYLEKSQKASA